MKCHVETYFEAAKTVESLQNTCRKIAVANRPKIRTISHISESYRSTAPPWREPRAGPCGGTNKRGGTHPHGGPHPSSNSSFIHNSSSISSGSK